MMKLIYKTICISCLMLFVTACEEEPFVDNPSGEVFIYSLNVTNGGLTGTETYAGTVDEASKTVAFNIPAETDIEALKVSGKLSLGAKLDKEAYDVTSGSAEIRVLNGENVGVYTLNVTLQAPKETPLLSKVVVKGSDGQQKDAFISEIDKTVYLGVEGAQTVEIVEIVCMPKRTVVTLTEGSNNMVSADNPGRILMDFEGLKSEYRLSFEGEPVFGADFTLGTVYDYSLNPLGADIYADFAAENTRSVDFDGKNLLIVSREGGTFPKLLSFESIKAGSPVETVLNTTGIAGGTYTISAGRLAQGHVYISNLTTGVAAGDGTALKVYHWADANSVPEVIFTFEGEASNAAMGGVRLGDNLSVNLDEAGNGTMYFVTQDGTQVLRCDVTGFTNVSNPTQITPSVTAPYYAAVNQVGTGNEYVYTSTQAPIVLVDRDFNELFKLDIAAIPSPRTDARIITYDSERYLVMTSGKAAFIGSTEPQTLYVYDLSAGANTALALSNFAASERKPLFTYSLDGPNCSAPSANTGWGVSDEGSLLLMGAATKSGFAVIEFPEKQ